MGHNGRRHALSVEDETSWLKKPLSEELEGNRTLQPIDWAARCGRRLVAHLQVARVCVHHSSAAMTENGAAKQNELYQGVHKASTAYKLLASMGWKEGQGLVRAASQATTRCLACTRLCSRRRRPRSTAPCCATLYLAGRAKAGHHVAREG